MTHLSSHKLVYCFLSLFLFFFLAISHGMWDLSFLTRKGILALEV